MPLRPSANAHPPSPKWWLKLRPKLLLRLRLKPPPK